MQHGGSLRNTRTISDERTVILGLTLPSLSFWLVYHTGCSRTTTLQFVMSVFDFLYIEDVSESGQTTNQQLTLCGNSAYWMHTESDYIVIYIFCSSVIITDKIDLLV